jgi:hypothetical protein
VGTIMTKVKVSGSAVIDFKAPNKYRPGTIKELNDISNKAKKEFDFARFGIRIPTKKS